MNKKQIKKNIRALERMKKRDQIEIIDLEDCSALHQLEIIGLTKISTTCKVISKKCTALIEANKGLDQDLITLIKNTGSHFLSIASELQAYFDGRDTHNGS